MLMLRPKTGPTLCASLRSQNALGHVTRAAFDGNLREKCRGPEPRRRLCASLCSRNTHPHVTRAIYTEIYRKNATAQNRGADFLRACAVETHIHMSQEPFIRKFTGKMPRPRTAAQTFCEPAQSKHTSTCHKSHLYGNLQEKCNGPEPRRRLSASLRSRNTHPHVTRAALYGNSQEKGRGPEPRPTLCASLHSQNAYQHVTKPFYTFLNGNLQEKCHPQLEHPDQAQAFTTTVRTPQCGHTVWGKRSIMLRAVFSWLLWLAFPHCSCGL